MTKLAMKHPALKGVWPAIHAWMSSLDDIVHHDPAEALRTRIEGLEARIAELEAQEH